MKAILDSGELVPDELTVSVVRERLEQPDTARGFVLDGFPRNLPQAEALDRMLGEIGRAIDLVLFFGLDDDVAYERMLGRAAAEARTDDTPEVIRRRLQIYHELTAPVVEYYSAAGTLRSLDASGSVDEVAAKIRALIIDLTT